MCNKLLPFATLCLFAIPGRTQPYKISTVAGTDRLLNGHSATTVPLRGPTGVAVDKAGNMYIADAPDNRIRLVNTAGVISTYAGTGLPGYNGDQIQATTAELNFPSTIAFDSSGNLYVADQDNNRVRMISPSGAISTVAGNGTAGYLGDNGQAVNAEINAPIAIAVDNQGNLYFSTSDYWIRKVDTNGIITTIAGNGVDTYAGNGGPAKNASLGTVVDMRVDAKGNIYLADFDDNYVTMIDTSGNIHAIAGDGNSGQTADNIPGLQEFLVPNGLALDSTNQNLYIANVDENHTVIEELNLETGLIHAVAGNGTPGFSGDGGPPLQAELNSPGAMATDSGNNLYVTDFSNFRVRKITASEITTVAGTSLGDGGPATSAFLNYPHGLVVDGSENIVVADNGDSVARRFTPGGNISTLAQLNGDPLAVAVDSSGNFYVTDEEPLLLEITPAGVVTTIAGDAQDGYSGDNGPATSAMIGFSTGVALDASGNIYFGDTEHYRIRKVTRSTGVISTIAGNGSAAFSGDNGPALDAGMSPAQLAFDQQGNLYLADFGNHRIRKIAPDGTITTVAGNGVQGFTGDGGPASLAEFNFPSGVAFDSAGNLYIADQSNGRVRRVNTDGLITTIAGSGVRVPNAGDGGPASAAQLDPFELTIDSAGNIFVSDLLNDRVRELTPVAVKPASLTKVSGDKQSGTVGAALSAPLVIKVSDASGNGVPGVVVNFSVNPSGDATVAPSPAITLNDGTVSANVTLGNAAGNITITAAASGLTSVSFSITANAAISPTTPPVISVAGIVSGGLSAPPLTTVAPNGMATVFGNNFAPPGTARQVGGQDLVDGKIPTNLIGVCAVFGTQSAPILGVYPTQLNVQVPQVPPGEVKVQVITNCGNAQSQTSNSETVTIQSSAPEFFYFVHNADGHDPIAAINAVTHGSVGAPGLTAGGPFTPAKPGDLLTLFGTGFGATNPAFGPGVLPGGAAQVTGAVSITFGGVKLAPSDILYVGVTQNAGLYQVNLQVPANVPNGDQPLVITIGGASSPPGGYITVDSPANSATTGR